VNGAWRRRRSQITGARIEGPKRCADRQSDWASGANLGQDFQISRFRLAYLDDFVTEDCIVSSGEGPRRAGEGAVAVAARVISWASFPCCLTHLHHYSAYCGFYLCFCTHTPHRRPRAVRARTLSPTLTLLMTRGVGRRQPQGRRRERRGDCRRL